MLKPREKYIDTYINGYTFQCTALRTEIYVTKSMYVGCCIFHTEMCIDVLQNNVDIHRAVPWAIGLHTLSKMYSSYFLATLLYNTKNNNTDPFMKFHNTLKTTLNIVVKYI